MFNENVSMQDIKKLVYEFKVHFSTAKGKTFPPRSILFFFDINKKKTFKLSKHKLIFQKKKQENFDWKK